METSAYELNDKQREACAVITMRDTVAKISAQEDIAYEEALLRFAESPVYDVLFDFDTGVWKEGPEYILSLWEKVQIPNSQ